MTSERGVTAECERLLIEIQRLADPEYRRGSLMVAPTAQRVYGVRTPDLRRLARDWRSAHRSASPDTVVALVCRLWEGESREERFLGLEILCLYPSVISDLDVEQFDRWRWDIDNWGAADFLAGGVLGPWVEADPAARLPYLESLVGDRHLFSRRLGIVASVHLNRRGPEYGAWTLEQVERLIDERDPMITKAVSWALREMIRFHGRDVEAFVGKHGDRLAALPRREVRNKLRTGRKSGRTACTGHPDSSDFPGSQ